MSTLKRRPFICFGKQGLGIKKHYFFGYDFYAGSCIIWRIFLSFFSFFSGLFIWNLHYEQLLKYGKFRYGIFEYAKIDRMRMICKDIQSIQRKIFVTEFIKRNKSSLMFRIFGCMRGNMNLHEHPQSNYKEPKSLFRLQFISLLNYLPFFFLLLDISFETVPKWFYDN